jgi:hypothetical protein
MMIYVFGLKKQGCLEKNLRFLLQKVLKQRDMGNSCNSCTSKIALFFFLFFFFFMLWNCFLNKKFFSFISYKFFHEYSFSRFYKAQWT